MKAGMFKSHVKTKWATGILAFSGAGHNNVDPQDPRVDAALERLMEKVRGKK